MPEEQIKVSIEDGKIPGLCLLREKKSRYSEHYMQSREFFGATDVDGWIKNTLIDMINSAKKKIFLATFLMVYPDVEKALMDASTRLRGHVYVLTPLDNSVYKEPHQMETLSPEELEEAIEQQEERISELSRAGVYIREHRQCHAKFCVVDQKKALVMSSNLTVRSMEENPELGKILEDRSDVLRLDRIFQRMWVHGAKYELIPDKRRPESKSIPLREDHNDSIAFEPEGDLIWTYHERHHILEEIVRIISTAQSSLRIGSYVLRELHEIADSGGANQVLVALQEALSRGVNIEIIIHVRYDASGIIQKDGETHTYQPLFASANTDKFRLYGHQKNHAKYVIADNITAVMFTANIDGRYGLTNGIEVGFILSDPDDISWLNDYHTKLIDEAHRMILCEPALSAQNSVEGLTGLSVSRIQIQSKNKQSSLRLQQKVVGLITQRYLAWSRVPGQQKMIRVWNWKHKNESIALIQDNRKTGVWNLSAAQQQHALSQALPLGFIQHGDITVVSSWPYSTNELKTIVNETVNNALNNKPAIPVAIISASWFGFDEFDLPFEDVEDEWVKKLRNYLLNATLELKESKWWIRPRVRDSEVMDVIQKHVSENMIDIDSAMKDLKKRGWSIPGITTGTKVFREYYHQQTGKKVKKNGTIESEDI